MPDKKNSIKGVEIFSVGNWNGDDFAEKDLDLMVASFEQTKDHFEPPLKLGHSKDQKILQADGLPAAGYVDKVYRSGQKLLADFKDIPEKIYQLLKNKAYRKPSIELYEGLNFMGKKYEKLVGAVALLGADMPGVQNLDDILALYGIKDYDKKINIFTDGAESTKIYEYENFVTKKEGSVPNENKELIEAKATIQNLEAQVKNFKTELKAKGESEESIKTKLADVEKQLADSKKEFATNAEKLKQAEIDKQVAELEGKKLCSPAMKPFVAQLLDADKKEFSIKKEKEEKEYSRFELLQETLELASKVSEVNFDNSSEDNGGKKSKISVENAESEIEKYMADNKCTYTTAYKAVVKKYDTDSASEQDTDDDED